MSSRGDSLWPKRESETFNKIVATMATGNQAWAPMAPVLILGITKKDFTQSGKPNRFAMHDLGAAMVLITLEARALGLATHQMARLRRRGRADRLLGFQKNLRLGRSWLWDIRVSPRHLPNEKLIASEIAPRTRKPLSEIVFSTWGEPAKLG